MRVELRGNLETGELGHFLQQRGRAAAISHRHIDLLGCEQCGRGALRWSRRRRHGLHQRLSLALEDGAASGAVESAAVDRYPVHADAVKRRIVPLGEGNWEAMASSAICGVMDVRLP